MRYFVIEITTTESGTAKAITEKSTYEEAKMLFHQVMASAYANNAVTYAQCQIIDEAGTKRALDLKKPEPEPQPEPEE